MKKIFYLKSLLTLSIVFFTHPLYACTGMGVITDSGTIIGKNRDYYYVPQKFGLVMPIKQFDHWYGNPYHHQNKFYAITSAESVSMGVNQYGLSAIEEDSLSSNHPRGAKEYKVLQQKQGMPDGMILYGVLQNFNNVDEMIPYLSKIFDVAAPDFYQFSDAKKILTIEVVNEKNHLSKHKFTYRLLSKKGDYFVHTNIYLDPEFVSLNNLISNQSSLDSARNRLQRMTYLISHAAVKDIDFISQWFRDTSSNISSKDNPNECLNTSLFRTNLQNFKVVDQKTPNDKIFGTVATLVINNQGNFKLSPIYLMMTKSITTQENGKQLIKYTVLQTTIARLFSSSKLQFVEHEFVRNPPINGICS